MGEKGYGLHWQLYVEFRLQVTQKSILRVFPGAFAEVARNDAAVENYSKKEYSRVAGPFCSGRKKVPNRDRDSKYMQAVSE